MKHLLFVAIFAVFAGSGSTQPYRPPSVSLAPATVSLPPVILPAAEDVNTRQFVQLAWNAVEGRLDRVLLELDDPLASQNLELTWRTAAPHVEAGRLTGSGRLSWRLPGTKPYDPKSEVAYYEGQIQDGQFSGAGRYWHRSGTVYEGQWSGGLMSGTGHLQFGHGGGYQGQFVNGLFEGRGHLFSRAGEELQGVFEKGLLDGQATYIRRDGSAFETVWSAGIEDAASRRLLPSKLFVPLMAQGQVHADVSLLVSVDRRLPDQFAGNRTFFVDYQSRIRDGALYVFPDSDAFMAEWRGTAELRRTAFGFYDFFVPANFVMSFENRGLQPVQVVGGYLNVRGSEQDLEPYITFSTELDCGELTLTKVHLTNWGWSQPQNASIEGGLISTDGTQYVLSLNVPSLPRWPKAEINFAQALVQGSPVLAALSRAPLNCGGLQGGTCLAQAKRNGQLGAVAAALYMGSNNAIQADFYGTLNYEWVDRLGQTQRTKSPLRANLKVGSLVATSECGEGSDFGNPFPAPFVLPEEAPAYQYPFLLNGTVFPGTVSNWGFQIDSPKSSRHVFEVVLQLSDGREVRSGPIDLTYFKRADPHSPVIR